MRIEIPVLDELGRAIQNSPSFSVAQKKDSIQKDWEWAYRKALVQPPPGFYRLPWRGPDYDPMTMNRLRQLRVPLLQQRPRDGLHK